MLDQNERMEAIAEQQYFEMMRPDGMLQCSCGEVFDPHIQGGTLSSNPYAMPVCSKCLAEASA